jgi:DNA-directed RNA polymerase subunit M/transcription elongation factor TFIIS
MFCPQCGKLSFPRPSGDITCTNHKCGYSGPANVKMKVEGKEIDIFKTTSSRKEKKEYERTDTSGGNNAEWEWDTDPRITPKRPTCDHCGSSNLKVSGSDGMLECLDCKKFS